MIQATQRPGPPQDGSGARGLAVSLCLHLALFGALLAFGAMSGFAPAPEETLEVELVTPAQFARATGARPAVAAPPAPEASPPPRPVPQAPPPEIPAAAPAEPPPIEPDAMITAQKLLSDGILASPRSRGAREALRTLDPAERIEQLCNLEAMSQIHAWKAEFEPDRVVAYAMAGVRLTKSVLQADGAAFRSRRQWYGLRFRCEVGAGGARVANFQFRVGEAIPRSDWAAHELPPEH